MFRIVSRVFAVCLAAGFLALPVFLSPGPASAEVLVKKVHQPVRYTPPRVSGYRTDLYGHRHYRHRHHSHRYGSMRAPGSFRGPKVIHRKVYHRDVRRSGVYLRGGHSAHHRLRHQRHHVPDVYIQRQQRELRNRQVRIDEANRRAARATHNQRKRSGVVLGYGIITNHTDQPIYLKPVSECPRGHNCGYRLYGPASGPRIIRVDDAGVANLPAYDGLQGPKVITLD